MKTINAKRRTRAWTIAVTPILLLGLAVAVGIGVSQAARQSIPTTAPFVATFTLDHEVAFFPSGASAEGVSGVVQRDDGTYVRSTDTFRWEFTSLSNWTWSRLCCTDPVDGTDSRDQVQVRPDGTKWIRATPEDSWEFSGTFDPQEGMVPLPDLAPRHNVDTATDTGTKAAEASARTGIPETDIRTARFGLPDGTEILRFYWESLDLTVDYYETAADGYVVRHLSLVELTGQ